MNELQNVTITHDDDRWEVEVRATIPVDMINHEKERVIKDLARTTEIKGFRKGHVPDAEIVRAYGEGHILERAAEQAVRTHLPELMASKELNVVDTPRVGVEKVVAGEPVIFIARAPRAPEMKLPEYAVLAEKLNIAREEVSVSDAEYAEAETHFRRERVRMEAIDAGTSPEEASEKARTHAIDDLPAIDDAFVQSLGVANVAEFGTRVREQIKHEKQAEANAKHRAQIIDELVKNSTITYPAVLKDYELDDMEARLEDDVKRFGKSMDEYLSETKKTKEELRTSWNDAADKRVKMRLILAEIGRREKLDADPGQISREFEHAKKHYPTVDDDVLRSHIVHALKNEAVLSWLESRGLKDTMQASAQNHGDHDDHDHDHHDHAH